MINLSNDPAAIAKAQVDTWFGQTAMGPVFLARDARVYRLSPEEVDRMRSDAECRVLERQMRMRHRTYLAIFLVVAFFIGMSMLASRFEAPWDGVIKTIGYGVYALHGLWILYESLHYDGEVKAVRDGMAASLTGRVPLPSGITDKMTARNPFQMAMVACVGLLFVTYFAAEFLAHQGIDLISMIPPWLYFIFVPLVWGLYFLGHYYDRNRGVGS